MSVTPEVHEKLGKVLQLFLQPNFNVVSTTYLDLLLTHINKAIKEGDKIILKIVKSWLGAALNTWNVDCKPCQNVAAFTVKLVGTTSVDKTTFENLCQLEIPSMICSLFEFKKNDLSASMKMAFVTMFVNLLEHYSGRQWIIRTGAWKEIIRYAQQNHTMYVTKESQKFLSRFLILESNNTALCKEIICVITEPLVSATSNAEVNNQQSILNKHNSFEYNNILKATIDLILEILEYSTFYDFENPIPALFEECASIESRVRIVYEVSISTPFGKCVLKLVKLLMFCKLRNSIKQSDTIDVKSFEQFTFELCYDSTVLLSKHFILHFMLTKKYSYVYWKKLMKMKTLEIPRPYKFENQNIALLILPLTTTLKPKYMKEHYLFEEFINKLFDVTCTRVQRIAYSVRDMLLKGDFPMESICTITINYLLEIADIMDRESAVIVFQVICHALKNFVSESSENTQNTRCADTSSMDINNPNDCNNGTDVGSQRKKQTQKYFLDGDPINDKQNLLAALLNALNVLTKKFRLKWQECVETICVMSIAQDILNHPGVETKICILALQTCKLSIQNFMPPNLALLVDLDEYTKEIGPTLFKRIHDPNWEVQDSVFEILNTIACFSENKYPPYQNFLLENRFLEVAIDIVKNHSESYVRASALTFISTAVRINTLWEKLLSQSNLPELAMKIIYKESEAIVRREAVDLIKELYIHRKWQKPMISAMSQSMTTAAVLDLDWEVKVNALEFWRHFIKSHLTDQGMLDGHFPNVTFSKEHRKIVSLNETEIKQRLNKALDELSRQHCLGVLLVTLKDESDFEVSRTSANIINELRRILLEYKIDEPTPPATTAKDSPVMDTSYVRLPVQSRASEAPDQQDTHDEVIEEIVGANDVNLLAAIYSDSLRMDEQEVAAGEPTGTRTLEYISSVTRQHFLTAVLRFDLEGYIKPRSEWLQNHAVSFESVIDDVLVISEQQDVNSMDCY